MSTFPKTTALSKPTGSSKISLGTLSYFRARNKQRVFNIVIKEFEKSGLSQANLGRRLEMDAGQLSRYLNAPGNWTLDMFSDFLFAISGAEASYSISYPMEGRTIGSVPDGTRVADVTPLRMERQSRADAALIVQSVNAFAALAEHLDRDKVEVDLVAWYEASKRVLTEGQVAAPGPHWRWPDEYYEAFNDLGQALPHDTVDRADKEET